jgi:hypothetical protein
MNKALMKNSRYFPHPTYHCAAGRAKRHTPRQTEGLALALKMVGFAGFLGRKPVIPNRTALGATGQHGGQGEIMNARRRNISGPIPYP